jgi:undecaprenyl-diphosphatase
MPLAFVGLALAWVVMLLFGAMAFDRSLLIFFHAGRHPEWVRVAQWVTGLGDATLLFLATGVGAGLLLVRREWRAAALLLGITLSGRLLVGLQKDWTARIRPDAQGHLVPVETLAFPSGHAANATLVWLALALLLPRRRVGRSLAIWAAVWGALAVGLSRVMLGVHWPSDVIGGWAFGLFWTLLLLRLSGVSLTEGTPASLAHSNPEGGQNEQPEKTGADKPEQAGRIGPRA